mgnify:CR=1 FL=1
MDLFGKIFLRIDKVDKGRLVEEELIKVKQTEIKIDTDRLINGFDHVSKRLDLQQDQMLNLNTQLKDQMTKNIEFQQEFLERYKENQSFINQDFSEVR